MTKLQEVFIRNLRNERKRLRLTQEQAAEKIGITHSFYAAIEGGAKFPSVQKIQDIGEAFGVPPYRLFIDQPEIEEMPSSELAGHVCGVPDVGSIERMWWKLRPSF